MRDEVEYIEILDNVSEAIAAAKKEISGARSLQRQSSIRTGFSLSDLPDEEEHANGDINQSMRDLLESWQTLVETLFVQKVFLEYAPSLESCISTLSDIDQAQKRQIRSLVNLMIRTIENHDKHECSELRYATLLEIIMSHNADWTPSESLNTLWAELELRVEDDCEPEEFRRVAYKVLISLPWVPSSCELYSACSYEESESMYPDLPLLLRSKFDQIYKPLLRSDRVYQILEQIGDDSDSFTIAISYTPDNGSLTESNGEGTGKTTLAALLAAHPSIAQQYSILWVDLTTGEENTSLSHRQYIECLQSLCQQLGVTPNWPKQILRLEDESLRIKREREHMIRAKQGITKLFQKSKEKVLIVLDGANDEKDYEWFRFIETQSSIVISKSNYIPRATYTVEMEGLGEDEAIALFASEASQDRDHPIFQTVEAKTIMHQCMYHPLIIRTAAHWFNLKHITSGLTKGLEELNLELSVLRHNAAAKAEVPKVLAEVMNMMLSPAKRQGSDQTKIMKLCLSSVAVVFSKEYAPLDAVLALWSQLLVTNPRAAAEIGENVEPGELHKRVWFISETFMHLGLFSTTQKDGVVLVKLHHRLYVNYGLSLVPEVQAADSSLEETKSRWHNCFVLGYNARLKVLKSIPDLEDTCRPYALEKIITHMMEAKLIPKVIDMLKDERFCRERLKIFGWSKGARCHVNDCLLLKQRAIESNSASLAETRKVILSCFKKFASILSEETLNLPDALRIEKAMALHLVGFTQTDNNGINEALTQYKNAMQIMPNPGHPFNAVLMYSQAVLHLIRNDHDKGFKKIKGCLKVLKDSASLENSLSSLLQPELLQLRGDALAAACDYMGAETSYEEALDQVKADSKIETGTALYRRGRLHQIMGELDPALSALAECINWKLDIGEDRTKNLAAAYSATGDMYLELGENKSALKNFEHALGIIEELKEETEEVDHFILNGKVFHLRGDDKSSKDAFDVARELTLKSPRLLMDQSAYELRCMGKISRDRGEEKLAADIFEEGLELTKERPESLERACILYELGHCLFGVGNNKDTIACFEEALKIRKSKLGDCELVLDSQITLGKIYRKLAMHRECLGVSKEVMFLTEKLYRGDDEKAARALFGVAESYEVLQEYTEAVAMFEECRELLKRALCGDHPDIANVLQRLAKLHTDHKDFDKAYKCYSEALEIYKANFEPNNPQLGETLYGIGIIARKRGDYEIARDYLQEALSIFKQLEQSRETCQSLIELGNVYRLMKDPDTAIVCYERCLTFLDPAESDDSIFGNLYLSFGHARLNKSEIMEAMECYDNALKNRMERLGRDHPTTAKASRSMGIVKYVLKSFAEAKIYLSDFVRVMDAQRTVDDIDYVIALQLLGEVYNAEDRRDDAKKVWSRAKKILRMNPSVSQKIPEVEELISNRLEAAQSATQEKKTLFSRFTELARFEDEQVSREVPIEERIQLVFRTYVFVDDEKL